MVWFLDTMILQKNHARPCRIIFDRSRYLHRFGGLPKHKGTVPRGGKVSMHHLLTLDLRDPLCPVETKESWLRYVPLYYPLRYGCGGGQAQYQIISNEKIKILHINETGVDEEVYPFMTEFPEFRLRLEPFSYEQFRALLMAEQADAYEISAQDEKRLKSIGQEHLVQIGGPIFPLGSDIRFECQNPKCSWFGRMAVAEVIARFNSDVKTGVEIFGEFGADVQIYFSLCQMCGTIVTQNRCT